MTFLVFLFVDPSITRAVLEESPLQQRGDHEVRVSMNTFCPINAFLYLLLHLMTIVKSHPNAEWTSFRSQML